MRYDIPARVQSAQANLRPKALVEWILPIPYSIIDPGGVQSFGGSGAFVIGGKPGTHSFLPPAHPDAIMTVQCLSTLGSAAYRAGERKPRMERETHTEPTPSPRVARLLDRWAPTGQERTWYPNGGDERAILLHEYFQRSEGEPVALRYAHGLEYVLSEIAVAIDEDEWIVGQVGLEDVARTRPDELAAAKAYWHARSEAFHRTFESYPAAEQAAAHGLSHKWYNRDGHAIPAFDLILDRGLGGLKADAQRAASGCDPATPEDETRQVYWQAMIVALDALSAYIRRYAALARERTARRPFRSRQVELAQIAGTCEWIAARPPRTFWEALQLMWFVHLGIKMDDGGVGHSFGRFDQYLYPFYRADVDAGRLSVDQARELLAHFWCKLNREGDDIAHLSLGGQTPAGEDATNELSHLCLQVDRWVSRKQPNLSTRVHAGTPDATWREIARTVRRGAGHPALFNDAVIVPGLVDYGVPVEVARDHAQVGCVETFLPGLGAPWTDCYLNLAKCLELALGDGRDMRTGERLGPPTGDPRDMTFDALFCAYEAQVQSALYAMLAAKDDYDAVLSQHAPEPLNSAFIRDCLERGLDATGGGARYLLTGAYGVGLGTTVDSLAAIEELVYREGLLGMEELLAALQADFDGPEHVLNLCRRRTPKYGNDDDRADLIAVRVIESLGRQAKAYPSRAPHALHYAMFGSVLSHTTMGSLTAASANGRRAGGTLSDGGSPSQGCNRSGATAALRSLAKADYRLAPGGAAINLRLSPRHLQGEAGLERLVSLLKTYVAMGGEQLQVTVVDAETLRQAIEAPELHRDLVVRVAGFTAYFCTLKPELQAEIVARAEATL
jgi:pyruvate formate-lyase/glycerol dehydratase family glycyl radical enzyme